MDLARHSVGRLSVLDLPDDILCEIFDSFANSWLYHDSGEIDVGYRGWANHEQDIDDNNFRAIQSTRLVCRRFCQIASPLLVPVLRAQISSESLRRIDNLTRNPQIAAGVRLVQVQLAYRPKEVAENLSLYVKRLLGPLDDLCRRCDYYTEFTAGCGMEVEEDREPLYAMKVYANMERVWGLCVDEPEAVRFHGRSDFDQEDNELKDLLFQRFEEYQHKHQDASRLLMDGSFVRHLSASINCLPSLRALSFFDNVYHPVKDDSWDRENIADLARKPEKLRHFMLMPLDWIAIEKLQPASELLPLRVLWELPIAIHERGTPLREVAIFSFPTTANNLEMLRPSSQDRFRAAFESVRKIHVGEPWGNLRERDSRQQLPSPDHQALVNNYLAALVSSPCLEHLHLGLNGLGVGHSRQPNGAMSADTEYPVGTVLASAPAGPRLKSLQLQHLSFLPEEFVKLVENMSGHGKLDSLDLMYIGLRPGGTDGKTGGWARILDILREKVGGREVRFLRLVGLYGAGFDALAKEKEDSDDSDSELDEEDSDDSRTTPDPCKMAEMYVRSWDESVKNPVAEVEKILGYTYS